MNRTDCKNNSYGAVAREYARLASEYDARWAFYIDATMRKTLEQLDLKPSDRLLDVGCGTGSLLPVISERFPSAELVGLDLCIEMLSVARGKLDGHTALVAARAENLPFPDCHFDIVVSCSTLHYIRYPEESLLELQRVLKPGGKLIITDWCDDYITCRMLDRFLNIFNRAHFKTYGTNECIRLLSDAGFGEVCVERYKISRMWGLMTARALKEKDEA